MRTLFKHAHLVVDDKKEYLDGALLVEDGHIIESYEHFFDDISDCEIIDLGGSLVMPGFFDTHCHGIGGVMFNACDEEKLEKASLAFSKQGVTSFLASLTNHSELFETMALLGTYKTHNSRFQGFHLEGPFLNEKKSGAIDKKGIKATDIKLLNDLLCTGNVRQMTMAPEIDGASELSEVLKNNDVRIMLGHSDLRGSIDIDYDGFTHLYNAMNGFAHRDGGLVNSAFFNRDKYCELICDGVHVDKDVVLFTLKNLSRDRVMIISDSTLAAGCPDGDFMFEGNLCFKDRGRFYRIDDGVLAGSVTTILEEVRNLHNWGVDNTDLVAYSSLNAYRFYDLDKLYGSLVRGKMADFVILDENFNLLQTYISGVKCNV